MDSPTALKVSTGHFYPRLRRGRPFESHIHSIKNTRGKASGIFYGVDNGTRTHDLQSHNLTP